MTKDVKRGIIFFSDSDYTHETGGTEKFLYEIVSNLVANGYCSVQVYPVRRINRLLKRISTQINVEYVSINFNEQYYGSFRLQDLAKVLINLSYDKKIAFEGIVINQMNYFNKHILSHQMNKLQLPIRYIVHDFTSVCPYIFWDSKTGTACNTQLVIPCKENCGNCNYLDKAIINYRCSVDFFDSIALNLDAIICPSANTLENWKKVFKMNTSSRIRSHLVYDWENCKNNKINSKLRVAFMGQTANHKGVSEWNSLVREIPIDQYEFYYLGNSGMYKDDDVVKTIRVDYMDKTILTMPEQLEKLKIDIVFQWSKCQETYSYTYFEATSSGCFVITNKNSGNIAAMTMLNKNGRVFENMKECIEWFKTGLARKDVEEYRFKGKKIKSLDVNPDISDFIFERKNYSTIQRKKVGVNPILYVLGKIAYFHH